MQFVHHQNAGEQSLQIDGELHKYIFKVRRYNSTQSIYFRNLNDNNIYEYKAQDMAEYHKAQAANMAATLVTDRMRLESDMTQNAAKLLYDKVKLYLISFSNLLPLKGQKLNGILKPPF